MLVQTEAPSLKGDDVCCGSGSVNGCGSKAWVVRGSETVAGATQLAHEVTVLVSSSARPRDDGDANMQMLLDTVRSVTHGPLQLVGASVVLTFDGLNGKPGVTPVMRTRYASKIRRTLLALRTVSAIVVEPWLHQANTMRCALEHVPRTRLLFVIQDDTQVGGGPVDTASLYHLLVHDPQVEYIKFTSDTDCMDAKGRTRSGLKPCTAHPTSNLLHRTDRWVDRPHFATMLHYETRLFATLPRKAKATPEQWLDQRSRAAKDWPLWTYGRRGDMSRDLHWPQLVDGHLVTKELLPELRKQGKVVNSSRLYAHSYLVHAYRGRDQDVQLMQVEHRAFRAHNPLSWEAEDGLSGEDLVSKSGGAAHRPHERVKTESPTRKEGSGQRGVAQYPLP